MIRAVPATASESATTVDGEPGIEAPPPADGFFGELKAGWQFLRGEPALLANTLQATVAQLTVGVLIALMPAYAMQVFESGAVDWKAAYGFIETGQVSAA